MKQLNASKYFICIIIFASLLIRVWGIGFGFPFFLHPDETKIIEPALTMAFNIKEADFNPRFFYYPHFLTYLLVFSVQIVKLVLLPFGTFSSLPKEFFYLLGRILVALMGTASVYVTYLLGKKVAPKGWDEKIGLLSALFLSVAFLHVRNSHYYTGDVPATFFILLSFFFFVRFINGSCCTSKVVLRLRRTFEVERGMSLLAGFFAGVGASTKYYPILLLLIYIPMIVYMYRKSIRKLLLNCSLVILFAVLGFVMFTPYAVLDSKNFIKTMKESNLRSSSGFMGASSNNPLYYIYNEDLSIDESFSGNSLVDGLGWGILTLSIIGITASVLLLFSHKTIKLYNNKLLFITLIILLYYIFFCRYPVKLVRWLVPIVPFLCISTSYAAIAISTHLRGVQKKVGALILIVFMLPNFVKSLRFDFALSRGDTRVRAYNYILKNIPKGTPMIFESILIHKMVEEGGYPLFQVTHDRYNTRGEIEEDYPPNLDELIKASNAKYIMINGWTRQKYFNKSSYEYFPEISKAWREFYMKLDAIDKIPPDFPRVATFDPAQQLLSGPKVTIYSTRP